METSTPQAPAASQRCIANPQIQEQIYLIILKPPTVIRIYSYSKMDGLRTRMTRWSLHISNRDRRVQITIQGRRGMEPPGSALRQGEHGNTIRVGKRCQLWKRFLGIQVLHIPWQDQDLFQQFVKLERKMGHQANKDSIKQINNNTFRVKEQVMLHTSQNWSIKVWKLF